MPDLDKLYEKAEKYLQKQKFESALEMFLEIHKYDPDDEEILLHLADLSLKLNRNAEGLRFEALLLDRYIKKNDLLRAIAACRRILKISPQDAATLMKMGGLLEKSKKLNESLEAYRAALELHRAAGAASQVLECLQQIVKLDPENLDAQVELAEQASRARLPKIGTPAFLRAAALAQKAGQEDRSSEFVERAFAFDPEDEAARLAMGEVYLKKGQAGNAAELLEPFLGKKPDDIRLLELLSRAYLQAGDFAKAEPAVWKLFQIRPELMELLQQLLDGLLQAGNTDRVLELVRQLKVRLFQQGKRNEFLEIIEKAHEAAEDNLAILELLCGVYEELNKEDGLRRSLHRLFNLYLASEQYPKAADTLEKMIDVDPYAEGHYDRLLNLEGHIDKMYFENISSRLAPPAGVRGKTATAEGAGPVAGQKAEPLDDLIVEGEMYYQYQLATKLSDTLQKISRLYPGAEEKNPRLRDFYNAAGFVPAGAHPAAAQPAAAPEPAPVPEPARPPGVQPSLQSLDELRKISEITASIYRESAPQGVMQTSVNEIGRALNLSRCWGALGTADRPPALIVEYCSPAISPSDLQAALKVYEVLARQAVTRPDGWQVDDVRQFAVLAPVRSEVQKLGIKSLYCIPLMDKDQPAGLLILQQCDAPRAWTPGEAILLKAIATQVVVAVNNTKLRRLVRSLSGTDQETGLLPRSSYIDCLQAEAARSKEQSQPLSVCLCGPSNAPALAKKMGEAAIQKYVQQVSKVLLSNLRQNDIAVRYSPFTIAVVFPDTPLPQGGLAVEKLRRVIGQVKLDGGEPPVFCGVVCDVPLGSSFDPVDGVTEVINRLETSLEQASKEGGKRVIVSQFQP